jgi:hypothetical protein
VCSRALSPFCSTMFRTGGTTGQAQLAVAAISRLEVDVAARPESGFAAVLGSCVRASSSKTRRPALPPETQRQADAAEPSHPRQRPRGDSQTRIIGFFRFGIAALAGTVEGVRWVVEGGHVTDSHSAGSLPTK